MTFDRLVTFCTMDSAKEFRSSSHSSKTPSTRNANPSSREIKEYDEKISSMRKYLPFLKKIISNLEKSHSRPKVHVGAAKGLYDVLTNPTKRIRMDSLLRMETLLTKLYEKKQFNESSNYKEAAEIIKCYDGELENDRSHRGKMESDRAALLEENEIASKKIKLDTGQGNVNESEERVSGGFEREVSGRKRSRSSNHSSPNTSLSSAAAASPLETGGRHQGLPPSTMPPSRHDRIPSDQRKSSKKSDPAWHLHPLELDTTEIQKCRERFWDSSSAWGADNPHSLSTYFDGGGSSPKESSISSHHSGFRRSSSDSNSSSEGNKQFPLSPTSNYPLRNASFSISNTLSMQNKTHVKSNNVSATNASESRNPKGKSPLLHNLDDKMPSSLSKAVAKDIESAADRSRSCSNDVEILSESPSASASNLDGAANKYLRPSMDFGDDESPGMLEEKQVFSCRHCSYVGKKIVPHYVNRHPHKEVPVRLPAEELEEALKEQTTAPSTVKNLSKTEESSPGKSHTIEKSILDDLSWVPERSIFARPIDCKICGYTTVVKTNLIQHLMAHRNPEKNPLGLQFATPVQLHCRFCEYSVSNVQDFRDHVTAHTGEFMYMCGYCPFRGFSSKSVRSHITCTHMGQPPFVKRDADTKQRGSWLVGYVCEKCNFVQLSEASVNRHMSATHSGQQVKKIKINMSRTQKLSPSKKVTKEGGDDVNKISTEPLLNSSTEEEKEEDQQDVCTPLAKSTRDEPKRSSSSKSKGKSKSKSPQSLLRSKRDSSGGEKSLRSKGSPIVIDIDNESHNDMKITINTASASSKVEKSPGKIKKLSKTLSSKRKLKAAKNLAMHVLRSKTDAGGSKKDPDDAEPDDKNGESPDIVEILNSNEKLIPEIKMINLEELPAEEENVPSISHGATDEYFSDSDNRSPPFLMPESSAGSSNLNEIDAADKDCSSRIVPSIAETILRLQATLKKTGKTCGTSPPVLEPMDGKFIREKTQNSGPTVKKPEAEAPVKEYFVYRCGARHCGSFYTNKNKYLSHLESSHKPREAPCTECGGTFAQWKLLLKHIHEECQGREKLTYFACGFSSCPFFTTGEDHFYSHVRRYHKREMQLPCHNCAKKFTLVTGLVNHIKTCCNTVIGNQRSSVSRETPDAVHEDKCKTLSKIREKIPDNEPEELANEDSFTTASSYMALKVVYECPFKECDHKSLERDVFRSHMIASHGDCATLCSQCDDVLGNLDSLVTHLETRHKERKQSRPSRPIPPHARRRKSAPVTVEVVETGESLDSNRTHKKKRTGNEKDSTDEENDANDVAVDEISNESERDEADDASDTSRQPASKTVTSNLLASNLSITAAQKLVDQPVPLETTRLRDPSVKGLNLKSKEALSTMLVNDQLQNLFKCMGRSCTFTTGDKESFILHISEGTCNPQLVCCYCLHECSAAGELADHVVVNHGHCTFQCKHCFYRAASEDYATHHQQLRHHDLPVVVLNCTRHPDAQDPVNDPVSSEFVIPYRCAIENCQFEVADPEEFHQHNVTDHSSVSLYPCHHCGVTCLSSERLLIHYKIHGCNNYQCGFCLHGAETEQEILFHLCSMHPNRRGRLFVRAIDNKTSDNKKKSETVKDESVSSDDNVKEKECTSIVQGKLSSSGLEVSSVQDVVNSKGLSQETGRNDGKVGHALFVCGYPPCCYSASTAESLREHMVTCTAAHHQASAQCPHCPRQWRTVTVFLEHVVTQHGGRRFICGKCPFRGPTADFVQNHMKRQHGIPLEQTHCILKDANSDPEVGEYLVQESILQPKSKMPEIRQSERRPALTRRGTTYGVEDLERLPMQSIFLKEVFCSICGYATKVRSNLIRHLQLHRRQGGTQDDGGSMSIEKFIPENDELPDSSEENSTRVVKTADAIVKQPEDVPEAQKQEVSAVEANPDAKLQQEFAIDDDVSNCPQHIEDTSLFRCGVDGCDYLALDSIMYRCHVNTLHPDNGLYPCPHCSERLTNLEKLIKHFRLHGPRLYKCGKCSYVNSRRHPVESHKNTVHSNRFLPVITVREIVNEDSQEELLNSVDKSLTGTPTKDMEKLHPSLEMSPSSKSVWCCALCQFQGPTKINIKNHLQGSHGVRSEFRCGVCTCVSNAFEGVRLHFISKHPNIPVQIMPLIVRTKDFDPENLLVTLPSDADNVAAGANRDKKLDSEESKSETNSDRKPDSEKVSDVMESSIKTRRKTKELEFEAKSNILAAAEEESESDGSQTVKCIPQNGLKIKIDLKRTSRRTSKDSNPVQEEQDNSEANDEYNFESSLANMASENICVTPDISFTAGSPTRKALFVCPICHEYKTRFRGDMRIHIYRELFYKRVQCLHCNVVFVSEKEAKHHSFKSHRNLPPSFRVNEVPERENWVKEQLDAQVRSWGSIPRNSLKVAPKGGEENSSPFKGKTPTKPEDQKSDTPASLPRLRLLDSSTEEKTDEPTPDVERYFRYYCPQCNYQCEGTTDLRKHIFRHLKFKPFQCQYCELRFNEKQQIRNHHLQLHPEEEFICQRDPDLEPERYVDELLQQQRIEWRDKKKSVLNSPIRREKSLAQMKVAKMAEESEIIVTSETGEIHKAYTCKHEGCTFTCSQIKGLKVHLMSHLRQVKYRCGYCHLTGSSQYQLRRHCQHVHANRKVLVHSLKADAAAVPVQESVTKKKVLPPVKTFRTHQCPYCPYSHSLIKMISRHMMRHYVEKPFQCGYCKRTGIEKFDILYHCRKVHSDREPKVISIPMPSNPEIRPILRRGYGHLSKTDEDEDDQEEDDGLPSSFGGDENETLEDDEDSKLNETKPFTQAVKTKRTYECNICRIRLTTKAEIKKHLQSSHDENGPRYRVIVTAPKKKYAASSANGSQGAVTSAIPNIAMSNSDDKRTSLLKCIYCDLASDSLKLLRKHCHEAHTDSEVRLRKLPPDWEPIGESILRCGYCGFAVTKMADLWEHHCQDHTGKSVKFRVSVRKNSSSSAKAVKSAAPAKTQSEEVFWCSYCNDPCESLEKMIRHWKMFHGHLEFKYTKESNGEDKMCEETHTSKEEMPVEATTTKPENSTSQEYKDYALSGLSLVKIFGCARCKYESDKYDMVRQHLFRHLQRFMCYVCLKTYPFEYEVKKHFETHHSDQGIEVVKNPMYNDEEKEDLIRNIRIRIADKSSIGHLLENPDNQFETDSAATEPSPAGCTSGDKEKASATPKTSRQVARKSFKGASTVSLLGESAFPRLARTIAKKSTSSRIQPVDLKWKLVGESLSDFRNTAVRNSCKDNEPMRHPPREAEEEAEVEDDPTTSDFGGNRSPLPTSERVSLSLRDLYALVNLQPQILLTELSHDDLQQDGVS